MIIKGWPLLRRTPQLTDGAIALLAGVFMGLAPAPANAWFLAWVALVPLWILLRKRPSQPNTALWPKLRYGLLWGIGYHGLALFWITGIHPMTWMGVNWWASLTIAIACWVVITLWGAVLVSIWAGMMGFLQRHYHRRGHHAPAWVMVLVGVAVWCGLETLWWLGPLNWSAISYTQSPYNLPILHLGQLAGPWAITAALVLVNGCIAEAILHTLENQTKLMRQWLVAGGTSLIALHLLGGWLSVQPLRDVPDAVLNVGIIQGNIPNTIKLYESGLRRAIEGYTTGYRELAQKGVDVVLTPETALPIQWTGLGRTRSSIYRAILEEQVPIWLGAFGGDRRNIANSLFTVDGQGQTLSEYRKVKLVPLGEYIPFEQVLGAFIDRLSPLDAHMIAGQPRQRFDTPFGRAIAAICYESAYPELFRQQAADGGEWIITASNNAHYSVVMPAQHHAQDVMRAIETDRWAARATNTGYSAIVDPHGRTHWISQINTYETHAGAIFRRQNQTLYVRWGNWLTPVLLFSALAATAVTLKQIS